MRLNEFNRAGIIASLLIGAGEGAGLTLWQRGIYGGRAPVRARADPLDDRMDPVAVAFGIGKAAKRQYADAFAQHGAVGLVRKRPAILCRGEGRRLRKAHIHEDVVQRIDAAGEDEVAVACAKLMNGAVQRGERGGAGRICDIVGAAKVHPVCDPPGDDIAEKAGKGAFLPLGEILRNTVGNSLDLILGQPGLAQSLYPGWALQAA